MGLFFGVVGYATLTLPPRGHLDAPYHLEKTLAHAQNPAVYYVKNALRDAETPNIVTVILADYRGFDTLGETTVVFTAGVIVSMILAKKKKKIL